MKINRITAFSRMFTLSLSHLSAPVARKNWKRERTSAGGKIQTSVGCRGWERKFLKGKEDRIVIKERKINNDSVNYTNMI